MKKIFLVLVVFGLLGSSYAGDDQKLVSSHMSLRIPKMTYKPSFGMSSGILKMQSGTDVGKALNIYIGPSLLNGVGVLAYADFEIPMIVDNLTIGPYVGGGIAYMWNPNADPYTYYVFGVPQKGYNGAYQSTPIISFGGVAHYYFDWLIPNMRDEFDVFAKVKAGVTLGLASYAKNLPDIDAQVGGRIHFGGLSLYGTAGYGRSYVNVGISFKM